jgi:hypothetical protein
MRVSIQGLLVLLCLLACHAESLAQDSTSSDKLNALVKRQLSSEAIREDVDYWLPLLRKSVFAKEQDPLEEPAYVLLRYEQEKFNAAQGEQGELARKAALWRLQQAVQQYQKAQPENLTRKQLVDSLAKDLNLKPAKTAEEAVYDQLLEAFSPVSKSPTHREKIEKPFRDAFDTATKSLPKAWIVLLQAADAMQSVYGEIKQVPSNLPEEEKKQLYADIVKTAVKKLEQKLLEKMKQVVATPSKADEVAKTPEILSVVKRALAQELNNTSWPGLECDLLSSSCGLKRLFP